MIFQAAHISRAVLLAEWIDPSVLDENDPDKRDPELDLYDPRNPNRPPYSQQFLKTFRNAQLARVRRRTAWAQETLAMMKKKGGNELEPGSVTSLTQTEPPFLDPRIDPNDSQHVASFI